MARRLTGRAGMAALVAACVAALALAAALGVLGYRRYTERYTVTTEGRDGLAVARVVEATLSGASALKVATLTGTVQGTASDSRGFGLVNSSRVMKAPFEVEYFVDVAALSPRDFRWDEAQRTLTLRAPPVRPGKVNVDESRTYMDRTSGLFVTRGAMAAMQRQASAGAERVAAVEASRPERLAAARANARTALTRLFAGPLGAAGLGRVRVEIEFPGERRVRDERWDVSRSLEDVLGMSNGTADQP